MRSLKHLSLRLTMIAALTGVAPLALANTESVAENAPATIQAQTPEQAVAQQVLLLTRAMIDADGAQLQALSSAALSYGHSSGRIENQAQFIDQIVSKRSDFVSLELKNQTISVNGTTAIVRHELVGKTNDGGVPNNLHIGNMLVWQQEDGTWKLLARQAFRLPN